MNEMEEQQLAELVTTLEALQQELDGKKNDLDDAFLQLRETTEARQRKTAELEISNPAYGFQDYQAELRAEGLASYELADALKAYRSILSKVERLERQLKKEQTPIHGKKKARATDHTRD
jgi:hypothetical protein